MGRQKLASGWGFLAGQFVMVAVIGAAFTASVPPAIGMALR